MGIEGRPEASPAGTDNPLPERPSWKYVPDEIPKRKHGWDKNEAGFVEVEGVPIGKCPNDMTPQEAERLLNTGLNESPERGWNRSHPKRIYNIHKGVVYAATPTVHGKSYHGFPELPARVSRGMQKQLLALAEALGCEAEVRKWLKG